MRALDKLYRYKGFDSFSLDCVHRRRVGSLPHCAIAADKASCPLCAIPNCPILSRSIAEGQFTEKAMRECYLVHERHLRHTYGISFSENIKLS